MLRAIIALTVASIFFISGCSSSFTKQRKRSPQYSQKDKGKNERRITQNKRYKNKTQKKKYKKRRKRYKNYKKKSQQKRTYNKSFTPLSKKPNKAVNLNKTLILPTLIHSVDGTLMVLIDPLSNNPQSTLSSDPLKEKNFYIDHTEVTIKQYKKTHPTHDQSHITGKDACPSCPAMGIDWKSADKHCRAVKKFLPTESEWNLAAGSLLKKVTFLSVKNKRPIANLSGGKDGFISVAPVGSFPSGAGPYGTLDMIGNVWEWVDTPKLPTPKKSNTKKNKTLRVIKGGGWSSPIVFSTEGYRNVVDGDIKNPTFGFRCVKPTN